MQIRLFKLTALLFIAFSGYFASAADILHNKYQERSEKSTLLKESINKNPANPFNYEFIINRVPVQLINGQQYRTVHFAYSINDNTNTSTITVRYLNFICGRGNSELSRFRKLILFPFHAFW
ncbi:MAG: hypothetical protein ACXVJD_05840 [Mucilaginibacter sp.]